MKVLAVIPARYGSRRFPGKPLAALNGKPVIQHVFERVAQAKRVDDVVVATDDERIAAAIVRFNGRAVMTNPNAPSGTERVAEVARARGGDVVINVQGDEPLVRPETIDRLVDFLTQHQAVPMASLMTRLRRKEDASDPNVVKVVVDQDHFALYFSRASIPFERDAQVLSLKSQGANGKPGLYKHLGIYGYQRHFLLHFSSLKPTPLERCEKLEQLRSLEHGYRIKLLETAYDTVGIDTPEDLERVEQILSDA